MHQLPYELVELVKTHREGSYATQSNRRAMLVQMGEQLWRAGYKQMHAAELKGRHVVALLKQWQADHVSHNTIRNRLAVLRWWAAKIGKASVVARDNSRYGLQPRQTVSRTSKAVILTLADTQRVRNRYVQMSLKLQYAFGLRRQEAIKIIVAQADQGDKLVLRGSWTKGGQPRSIPILTATQRAILDEVKAFSGRGSLIPPQRTYVQQLKAYEHHTRKAGLSHMHGLRHAYAQARFADLAGFPAPAAGGPHQQELTAQQREADEDARLIVSAELGHHRASITRVYLGA